MIGRGSMGAQPFAGDSTRVHVFGALSNRQGDQSRSNSRRRVGDGSVVPRLVVAEARPGHGSTSKRLDAVRESTDANRSAFGGCRSEAQP